MGEDAAAAGQGPVPIDRQKLRADAVDGGGAGRHRVVAAAVEAGDAFVFLQGLLVDAVEDRVTTEARQREIGAARLFERTIDGEAGHENPREMSVEAPA